MVLARIRFAICRTPRVPFESSVWYCLALGSLYDESREWYWNPKHFVSKCDNVILAIN